MTVLSVKPVRKTKVFNDFDRLFDEFFGSNSPRNIINYNGKAAVNVIETGSHFQLELAAPGLEKNDFKVNVEKNILSIEVDKKFELKDGESYKRQEFGQYEFRRVFRLPDTVDVNGIEANYQNGILILALPKKAEAQVKPARQIEIQ